MNTKGYNFIKLKNYTVKENDVMKYAYFGISFGITLAAGLYFGYQGGLWLDAWFSTEPIFSLLGLLLGVGVAFRGLMDKIIFFEKKDKNRKEK